MVSSRRMMSLPGEPTNLMFEYVSTLISTLLLIFNTLWPTNFGMNTAVTNVGLILIVVSSSFGTVALKLPRERGFRVAATTFAILAILLFTTNGVAMAVLPIFLDCRTNTHITKTPGNACAYMTAFLIISLTMAAYGCITSILLTIKYIRFCRNPYMSHMSGMIPSSIVVMPRSMTQKYHETAKVEMPPPIDLMPSPPPYSQHEFDLVSKPESS